MKHASPRCICPADAESLALQISMGRQIIREINVLLIKAVMLCPDLIEFDDLASLVEDPFAETSMTIGSMEETLERYREAG